MTAESAGEILSRSCHGEVHATSVRLKGENHRSRGQRPGTQRKKTIRPDEGASQNSANTPRQIPGSRGTKIGAEEHDT